MIDLATKNAENPKKETVLIFVVFALF